MNTRPETVNREKVESIFQSMNLLNIKRSAGLLISLEQQDVEEFISVHSSIVIFLLNVLDNRRRMALLEKISDAAILYIVEEELRMRLIREISRVESGALLDQLSELLDGIDLSGSLDSPPVAAIDFIYARQSRTNNRFVYLNLLAVPRLRSCLDRMLDRNPLVLQVVLCYADSAAQEIAFSLFIQKKPTMLTGLPEVFLNQKIKEDYRPFLSEDVFEHLPLDQKRIVLELQDFEKSAQGKLDSMYRLARSRLFLSAVLEVSQEMRPEIRDYLFHKLRREFLLTFQQMCLLRTYQEQRAGLV
ncbi:MAG: hypothetical protein HS115_01940 [Spirochaetales bacterium]|nr:hypothetical protein [Spirochaetales bacterium]